MFGRILFTGFLLAALAASDQSLTACGDKFLVLGRSVGYKSLLKASKPGSLVLYRTPGLPKPFSNGQFDALMDAAGHRLSTVIDRDGLARALAGGKIDLVLAESATSHEIGSLVNASSSALVVPILESKAPERAALEKEFGCVLPLSSDPRRVIDVLDKAMKLRAKRAVAPHAA